MLPDPTQTFYYPFTENNHVNKKDIQQFLYMHVYFGNPNMQNCLNGGNTCVDKNMCSVICLKKQSPSSQNIDPSPSKPHFHFWANRM